MMNHKSTLILLLLTTTAFFHNTTATPVDEAADSSLDNAFASDPGWFTTDTLPSGSTISNYDAGTLIPSSNSTISRRQNLKDYLNGVKNTQANYGPYCTLSLDPNTCTFATRPSADQHTVELYAYDHWCKRIGHWTKVSFPFKDFSFFTELRSVIVGTQIGGQWPPYMWYEGRADGYGFSPAWCYNGGYSSAYPGFRMACRMNFRC